MQSRPVSVSTELQLNLVMPGASSLPVRAGLSYAVTDPYAVKVSFHTAADAEAVEWTFARQLLTEGVAGAAGEGDVRVWPSTSSHGPVVCLALCSPAGKALFEVPMRQLVEFLSRTYLAVPSGCESDYVDVEAELAMLLWAEPET